MSGSSVGADFWMSGPSFPLFTKEYFEKVRRVLSPKGFFVIQAGPVSPGELTLHARLVQTLKEVFPNVQSYSSYTSTSLLVKVFPGSA
uniref:PABS domain-containing protein n=1 Tax=Tolypothrix bouteillei VB521301 TaxID=1479485 RepID=A0A0C1RCN5_9CYAN